MPGTNDLLFGRIAVEKGYVTEGDVQECVAEQAHTKEPKPLGEMLLARGTITRRQMDAIFAEQQQRLAAENPRTHRRREDTLFGRLAWRLGMLTQEDLNACLRSQAEGLDQGVATPLGAALVREGYLTERQVQSILQIQRKAVVYCPRCQVLYTLPVPSSPGAVDAVASIVCPRCQGVLGEPDDRVPEEAEWAALPLEGLPVRAPSTVAPTPTATRHPTRRVSNGSVSPAGPPAEEPEPDAGERECCCPACDTSFRAAPDKFARVKCPKCRAFFLAEP